MTGLRHFADGEIIPGPTHSVSVSLPDIDTVIGFESGDAAILERIRGGYPRFRTHPFVAKLANYIRHQLQLRDEQELILTRSVRSANAAAAFAGVKQENVFDLHGASGLAIDAQDSRANDVRAFVQHTGGHMTSRHAEALLLAAGLVDSLTPETITEDCADEHIRSTLCAAYRARDPADVSLHNSGMNAVYAAIVALHTLQSRSGRSVWVQLGWIFFDTVAVLRKGIVDCEHVVLQSPFDLEALEAIVEKRGGELAGIIAEVSSNPLIQTPDIIHLRQLADRAGCALVLDATIATPYNVNTLGWADVVCESLTKYATGSVDVLMGAAIVNAESRFAESLRSGLMSFGERPHLRDAQRVAHRIEGYQDRMKIVNANTMVAARFLTKSPIVRRIHWAYDSDSAHNYEQIQYQPNSPGGLLMLDLSVPIEQVYDGLRCAKGPSFGWEFTMAAPQVFVAHFDLLATPEGRNELASHGLHRDMLRISIGTEDISSILSVFDDAFSISSKNELRATSSMTD